MTFCDSRGHHITKNKERHNSQTLEDEKTLSASRMPAGVDWFPYLKFMTASMLSMFLGAQMVHAYYKPEMEIPAIPPALGELGRMRDEAKRRQEEETKKAMEQSS